MIHFTLKLIFGIVFIFPHIENAPIENINKELGEEYDVQVDYSEAEPAFYANEEKRLFVDLLQHQTKEERINTMKELKEKNLKDQKRRRAHRRRRKIRHHQGRNRRVNRNIKRYVRYVNKNLADSKHYQVQLPDRFPFLHCEAPPPDPQSEDQGPGSESVAAGVREPRRPETPET